ncbi:phospholipase A1 member A-like [Zootermopsis nevadensis]|uniref:phospholipase A1 member A-like n=1 Tax=Zootermopsis nevadensis TaxID=136037 RepID=UPI000B8E797C|nr:phospholipase A1 member A-like [Zootermopsis nevadensis]
MSHKHLVLLAVAILTTTCGGNTINELPLHIRQMKNVHYDGGVPWMLIPDGDGVLHVAILTDIPGPITRDVAEDVNLELYTNKIGSSVPNRLIVNDPENLKNSGFDSKNPTKILVHGFSGNGRNSMIIDSKNAYLAKGDYNIIGVDWGVLCPSPNYITACRNAVLVGEHLADLVEFLVENGAKLEDIHITGHSLGGQVGGFAGGSTRTGKIGRITGLDTAYPMFGNADAAGRLDPDDAILVDAIHTCFPDPYTQVDFYPNGGIRPQPGCDASDVTGQCSHSKAWEYFIESIKREDRFPAVGCLTEEEANTGACTDDSTGIMGDAIQFTKKGIYYVDTTK